MTIIFMNIIIFNFILIKMKKDYLDDGSMADSADLVVLGGWSGTGKKGGQISSFLMGVHDQA